MWRYVCLLTLLACRADPRLLPTEPELASDGVTEGVFASPDGIATLTLPSGALAKEAGAHPRVTHVDGRYRVTLGGITTLPVLLQKKATLSLATGSGGDMHVEVRDPKTGFTAPLPARLDNGAVKVTLYGLLAEADYKLVPGALERTSPPPARDSTWRWTATYDAEALRVVTSHILKADPGAVSNADIAQVVGGLVIDNAVRASAVYQAAGFRPPRLEQIDGAYSVVIAGAGSHYDPGEVDESAELLSFTHGVLVIAPARLDDDKDNPLGRVRASIAHELLHAIQSGYDIPYAATTQGLDEGSAATFGVSIDRESGKPEVRTAHASEVHKLSNFLGAPNEAGASLAYANQDFFAFVGRVYGANRLHYLAAVFDELATTLDARVKAGERWARYQPTYEMMWSALDAGLRRGAGVSLADAYREYVVQRGMTHLPQSRLRDDEPSLRKLHRGLFHDDAVVEHIVDPDALATTPLEETMPEMAPWAAQALVLHARRSDAAPDVKLHLSLPPGVRAVLLRHGAEQDISGETSLTGLGKNDGDTVVILFMNASLKNQLAQVRYRLGGTAADALRDGVSAQIDLGNHAIDFAPTWVGAGHGEANTRTNLPAFLATRGSHDMLLVMLDPKRINGAGTYTVCDPSDFGRTCDAVVLMTLDGYADGDGTDVVFVAQRGSLTLTTYGPALGDRLTGSFSVTLSGDRDTGDSTETLSAQATGSFNVTLTLQTVQQP